MAKMKKTSQLKNLLHSGQTEFILEAHNGLAAKIVEEAGFKGIWGSGLALSAQHAVRDNNELSWTEVVGMLDFMSEHPEPLRIVALNLAQPEDSEIVPGYSQMQRLVTRHTEMLRNVAAHRSSTREIRMYIESFNALVINYLGAATFYAGILRMNPRGRAYRRWVKETLHLLFLPRLRQLIRGESPDRPATRS